MKERLYTFHQKWHAKYPFFMIGIILLIFIFRYIAPFGAVVTYKFINNEQVASINGLESADTFKKDANSLLKVPQQIIRKNIVEFSVKPLYKEIGKVGVSLRFKGNPKEILIGIRGSEDQKYTYRSMYDALLNPLPLKQEGELSLWQKKKTFSNINDFINKTPTTGLIGYYLVNPVEVSIQNSNISNPANTTIEKTLRGSHTFYVKVTQSPFVMDITKQDANQYAGEDKLAITVEKNNQVLVQKQIGDDGIINSSNLQLTPQQQEVKIDNAQKGIYKVTVKDLSQGTDVRIKKIEVNQSGVVFVSPVFIVDDNQTSLMTDAKNITIQTYHDTALQNIKLDSKYDLAVIRKNDKFTFDLNAPFVSNMRGIKANNTKDLHFLDISKSDIIISGAGYFSFTKAAYFNMQQSNFVDVHTLTSVDSVDYIIARYNTVTQKDGWSEAFVTFSPSEFKLKGDNLYFSLESPDLSSYGGEINVDSLEISVKKP